MPFETPTPGARFGGFAEDADIVKFGVADGPPFKFSNCASIMMVVASR